MKCARTVCTNEGTQPHRDLPGLYCIPCGRRINEANDVELVDLNNGMHWAQSGVPSPRDAPPQFVVVVEALGVARMSPCAKSKRGVIIYRTVPPPVGKLKITETVGVGFNGQPDGTCAGTQACRLHCNKLCVHAEARAIRDACAVTRWPKLNGYSAVHVKVDDHGDLVAGSGPSCWQCAREVADVELDQFWLYEVRPAPSKGVWVSYSAKAFLEATLEACLITE